MTTDAEKVEGPPCTCHPDDNPPVPCPRRYALNECRQAAFTEWFVKNYPGPDTIIYDPKWHAPRIYRAALAAAGRHDG